MAELVDALDLGSSPERGPSSTLGLPNWMLLPSELLERLRKPHDLTGERPEPVGEPGPRRLDAETALQGVGDYRVTSTA